MNGSISTRGGRVVSPLHLAVTDIDIRDIAHALSNMCRFTGHTKHHYSVAQHSVYVSLACKEYPLRALLHDASEAYLVDVPSPLKILPEFKFYRDAEERAMKTICEALHVQVEEPPSVKDADVAMFKLERKQLMPNVPDEVWQPTNDNNTFWVDIEEWTPERAEDEFLKRYNELTTRALLPHDNNRTSWHQTWMNIAQTIGNNRSYDPRLKVGAIIVTDDNTQILALGYNGNAKGLPNVPESLEPGQSGFLHGEMNALIKLDFNNPKKKTMYVTHSPCRACSKCIINAKIDTVVYGEAYRDDSGLDLMRSVGIKVLSIEEAILMA